jgi:ribosomal protein S11
VTYGVAPITLVATGGASGNMVVFSVLSGPGTISGNILTITGVGTVVVAANQGGDADYAAAREVTHRIVVKQIEQTITFTAPPSPVTYGVSPITLVATGGASGNVVVFSVLSGPGTISGNILTITGVGTVEVAADQSGNADYAAAKEVTHNIVVKQIEQTITFTAPTSPVTYGVSPITLSATASSGLSVTFSVVSGPGTISGNILTITGVGTVEVAADQSGNADYAAAKEVTHNIVVKQ